MSETQIKQTFKSVQDAQDYLRNNNKQPADHVIYAHSVCGKGTQVTIGAAPKFKK